MSAGKKPTPMAVPRSGAFAPSGAGDGQPAPGSVLSEVMTGAVEPAERAKEKDDAAPDRRRRRRAAPAAAPPMPGRLAGADALVPLQVKVSRQDHWDLKVNTTLRASNMTRVVTALLSVYNEDPELGEALIELAERRGKSLGEVLHDVLVDAAAAL